MQDADSATIPPPKRPHKAGDMRSVRAKLYWALLHAEHVMATAADAGTRVKGIHALVQCGLAYCKVQEYVDFQARIERLEALLERSGRG
jgi:hypothetical protein